MNYEDWKKRSNFSSFGTQPTEQISNPLLKSYPSQFALSKLDTPGEPREEDDTFENFLGVDPNQNALYDFLGNAAWGFGVRAVYESGRGFYFITRSFFDFNTSGITGTLSSAVLKIRSYQNTGPGLFIVKSGHDPSDTSTEWYSTWLSGLGGSLSGWDSGDVTAYASEVDTSGVAAGNWIEFTLNATALADIKNNNDFKIVLYALLSVSAGRVAAVLSANSAKVSFPPPLPFKN